MNDIVHAIERTSFGFTDIRAVWGTFPPDYWHTIWMAVSCCCGLTGESESAPLPSPQPKLITAPRATAHRLSTCCETNLTP